MKRAIRLILAVLLCLSILPLSALAEEDDDAVEIVETVVVEAVEAESASAPEDRISEALIPEDAVKDEAEPSEDGNEKEQEMEMLAPDGKKITSDDFEYTIHTEGEKQTITISNIDPLLLDRGGSRSAAEIETEGIPSDETAVVCEEPADPAEYSISSKNIALKNGNYSYILVLRETGELTFDNDLEIFYQGVNGRYKLHYEIDETDNHIMIVTGTFENVIAASPLMKRIRDRISEDSYFYQLDLRTKEGFSFTNNLTFLFDGNKHGYSFNYSYDLSTDSRTLEINRNLERRTDRQGLMQRL